MPLDVTHKHVLSRAERDRLFAAQTMLTQQLQTLYQLADEEQPQLHDAIALAVAIEPKLAESAEQRLTIDARGLMRTGGPKPNAQVVTKLNDEDFAAWLVKRLTAFGGQTVQREPRNVVELGRAAAVCRGGCMCSRTTRPTSSGNGGWRGVVETARQEPRPPDGRHCRSVLTLDFDEQQGDHQSLYSAVIFNPVPGPPMGENTRLAFRYKLEGTDTLRVQMYSLTNGYHRQLTLRGLPQGQWREATVDMTQLRRPDGSGGALAKDERIDDIQFYAAPTATMRIDDVVLYEAAPAGEKRPFPSRLVFTGWFDTGRQGREWPGDFEIVPHTPPRTWKAAKSIENRATGKPWIRVSLRGERPVGLTTSLKFAYQLAAPGRCTSPWPTAGRRCAWSISSTN